MSNNTPSVTQTVFEQYQEIQHSGVANMVQKNNVQKIAHDREFHELVGFIEIGDYYELLQNYNKYDEKFSEKIGSGH